MGDEDWLGPLPRTNVDCTSAPEKAGPQGLARWLEDLCGVLAVWFVLLTVENLHAAMGGGAGHRLALFGAGELHSGALALAVAIPLAAFIVQMGRWIFQRRTLLVASLMAALAGTLAFLVSTGRHMQSAPVRYAFVACVSSLAFFLARALTARIPYERPRALALVGVGVAALAWTADAYVLRGLYPAFHAALSVVCLAGSAASWLAVRSTRGGRPIAYFGAASTLLACAWAPSATGSIASDERLRHTLFERAPVLGRTVVLAARFVPPAAPASDATAKRAAESVRFGEAERALDWSGRDILLLTVDALRADHLGAYGYPRSTSPAIDRLAARGVRFERAYSPVPNTSYSLTSLLTGVYMRPLLTGAVEGADHTKTWPAHLADVGYATAGFYPPAVFYVDAHNFGYLRDSALGFAHGDESYAGPELRYEQLEKHLETVPKERPAFVWMHVFEPHEPYVMHDDFPFEGGRPMDAYDSEIAASDALIGRVIELVEARHRGVAIFVTADHGEAFGEHGAYYHNGNVFDEQVRVPLIVVAPGVSPGVVREPVQTIDLLPTTLSALGVRRPPALRGRDLGALLAQTKPQGQTRLTDQGFAFAETEQQTMVAKGDDRMLCMRTIATCTLYDLATDPAQLKPTFDKHERAAFLKQVTAAIEHDNTLSTRPPMSSPVMSASRNVDADVLAARLVTPNDVIRRDAAMALAQRQDDRGLPVLTDRWVDAFGPRAQERGELDEARELLMAFTSLRATSAVPDLLDALDDVRLRGPIVEALERIGDRTAIPALLELLPNEPYEDLRAKEAQALVTLGAGEALRAPLSRLATLEEPMVDAIQFAARAGLLRTEVGGATLRPASKATDLTLRIPGSGPARLLVQSAGDSARLDVRVDGAPLAMTPTFARLWTAELEATPDEDASVRVAVKSQTGVVAVWLLRVDPLESAAAGSHGMN